MPKHTQTARKKSAANKPPDGKTVWQKFVYEEVSRKLIKAAPYNPRIISEEAQELLRKNIKDVGLVEPLVWNRRTGNLVSGHQRLKVVDELEKDRHDYKIAVAVVDLPLKKEKELNIFLNNVNAQGVFDREAFFKIFEGPDVPDLDATGYTLFDIETDFGMIPDVLAEKYGDGGSFIGGMNQETADAVEDAKKLAARKQAGKEAEERWKTRKEHQTSTKEWDADYYLLVVFDSFDEKVRWLADHNFPAESTYFKYAEMKAAMLADKQEYHPADTDLTPVEQHKNIWLKRDDLYEVVGVRGGKARTCWVLAQGAKGLVTAGSRSSPQVNIVAQIAKALKIPCHVHVPSGKGLSPELADAVKAGAEAIQHSPGHNSVIIARARTDAKNLGWREIPFGMECQQAIDLTRLQVKNLPFGRMKRIVVPVGSGMTLAGILHGLHDMQMNVPVLGVVVGANPVDRLDKYAPDDWRDRVQFVKSGWDYAEEIPEQIDGIRLDPIYEAKCVEALEPDDLLWIVGIRRTA